MLNRTSFMVTCNIRQLKTYFMAVKISSVVFPCVVLPLSLCSRNNFAGTFVAEALFKCSLNSRYSCSENDTRIIIEGFSLEIKATLFARRFSSNHQWNMLRYISMLGEYGMALHGVF